MQLGLVLVLFILLVIVTCVGNYIVPGSKEDATITGSKGFIMQNRTSNYNFVSTAFSGDFESPGPSANIVTPGGNYRFEVVAKPFYQTTRAVAQYAVYTTEGRTIGALSLTFETRNSGLDARLLVGKPISMTSEASNYKGVIYVTLGDKPPSA
ncbi:hypothetical protein M3223_17570 [Paenibacillus pasadenensis]|uniref:hypothetical protein n=1 Tax=Paenibacillus pasadenensis TaxID=217090 RepID=UPI00203E2EE7|nr:hypothetical protein [Paenibacillus pasadenensis]MCM3749170.1 hypothetical protein [Paenibacillus pasadenensis]